MANTLQPAEWLPSTHGPAPGAGSPPRDGLPPAGDGTGALAAFRRRWKLVLVATLLGGALAWGVGTFCQQVLWRSQGVLVYTPLPVPETQKGVYTAPTAQTLLALVKSPRNLQAVRSEFEIAAPPQVLDELIRVTQPRNAELIEIALDWPEPGQGAAIVNRLMELHVREVAGLRKNKVGATLANLEREDRANEYRLGAAQQEHDRFLAAASVADPKAEAERLDKDVSALEQALEAARQDREHCLARAERLDAFVRDPKAQVAVEKASEGSGDVLDGNYLGMKMQLLDTLRGEQGKLAETDKKLEAKEREYDEALLLASRGITSRSEVEKLRDEVALLTLQKANSTKAIRHHSEKLGSLPRQYAAGKKAELADQSEGLRVKAAQVESALEVRRKQAKEAGAVLRKADALAKKVKEAEAERRELQGQLTALRQLRDTDAKEFAVAAPATPASQPVSSNRLKITLAAFALPLLAFFGLVAGYGWVRSRKTADAWARTLGLRVLARPFGDGAPPHRPPAVAGHLDSAHTALRLARQLPEDGGVILFTSPGAGDDLGGLVFHLGRLLGIGGERVLIVDARVGHGAAPEAQHLPLPHLPSSGDQNGRPTAGLVQYLAFEADDLLEVIRPTKMGNVDYLAAGGAWPIASALPSRCLGEALRRLSEVYPRILILGPSLSDTLETEFLAGYADGVIVALSGSGHSVTREADEFVRHLKEAGTPFFGAVIRD